MYATVTKEPTTVEERVARLEATCTFLAKELRLSVDAGRREAALALAAVKDATEGRNKNFASLIAFGSLLIAALGVTVGLGSLLIGIGSMVYAFGRGHP